MVVKIRWSSAPFPTHENVPSEGETTNNSRRGNFGKMSSRLHALLATATMLCSFAPYAAEPLAQQQVVIHRVRDLEDPAKVVCEHATEFC